MPIACRVASGNVEDSTTHIATWDGLCSLLGHSNFRYVADCGASGYSVGLGIKGQSAKVEVDGGFEVLSVSVSTSGHSDRLHP